MSGNVWEWCTDWHPNYVGTFRVIRGGSWGIDAYYARCGDVFWRHPDFGNYYVGFRSVRPAN
jgi:formylglycine-generating enzyme required for sulfatase activity